MTDGIERNMGMKREEFAYMGINKNSRILEFAPYFRPLYPKSMGYRTDVVDVCSKSELVKKAEKDPRINDYSGIEEVDYVCSHDYAKMIGKKKYYDFIVASHVIEHVVDIISFLQDCTAMLNDKGVVRLFVPDKRYTFDNLREVVSTRTAIDIFSMGGYILKVQ